MTERVKRKIEEEGDVNAPPRVVITGHSLGGAMATLCAARLGNSEGDETLGRENVVDYVRAAKSWGREF